jgi:steroid delta-isomerase-like uncharacterized protein
MSHHNALDPVNKFYQVYNENKYELWNEAVAEDYVGIVNGRAVPSREVGLGFVKAFHAAFPDLHYTVDDTVSEPQADGTDRVATRWTAKGTHKGDFAGVTATGKEATMIGITIFQVRDGKIAALWNVWDTAGLIGQLKG